MPTIGNDMIAVFDLMQRQGGSFEMRLAQAWKYADSSNRRKIEVAFSDLVASYIERVKLIQKERGHG